jgi:dihydrofolate reductase
MIILGPVAVAKNGIIGGDNDLPWYFPEDLKHFKEITTGQTVLMGRKTYDSIVKRLGKPLPNRINVVITRQQNFAPLPGVLVFHDLDQALDALKETDVYIIGGAQIFAAALPRSEKMYMTHIHNDYKGDVYFPEVNWDEWKKTEEEAHEEYTYATYIRKS